MLNSFKIRAFYCICRVINCSPHLDGNRRWAQQAQYNKFVREWVKNWANSDSYNSYWRLGTWSRRLKHINQLRSYVRGVRFGLFNGFESSLRGTILNKMLSFRLYFFRCYSSYFLMFLLFLSSPPFSEGLTPLYSPSLLDPIVHLSVI